MPLVLTRRQALAAGRSPAEVDALVRSRRWTALRRGVYLAQSELPDDAAARHAVEVQAAVLAVGVPAVGSHESAAIVHELPLFVPYDGPPLLTRLRPAGGPRSDPRAAARLVAQVPAADRLVVHGAEVTSAARTAVDLARTRPPLTAVVALNGALRAGVHRRELRAVLDRQAGWPGVAGARERVEFADGRSESPLESVGRLRLAQGELPVPELQGLVCNQYGLLVARVDYLWREQRVVGEADGVLRYDDPRRVYEEKVREDRVRDAGFEVFRFGWTEAVHLPQVLLERAQRAFARARLRS